MVRFLRRSDLPATVAAAIPAEVVFDYDNRTPDELIGEKGFDTVVWAYDLNFTPVEHATLGRKFRVDRLPAAWFTGFVLNPRVKPFESLTCRRWFASRFREAFAAQELGAITPSASIFTKLIPGYKSAVQLGPYPTLSSSEENTCIRQLQTKDFVFAVRTQSPPPLVDHALKAMALKYGFRLAAPVVAPSSHSGWPSYKRADVSMQLTNSGFWPLDPVGDIQMLLTPHLHEDYMDISADLQVQKLLREISLALTPIAIKTDMERLNQYLYDNALFNIFSNQAYLYLSASGRQLHSGATFSVTFPYPWQVF